MDEDFRRLLLAAVPDKPSAEPRGEEGEPGQGAAHPAAISLMITNRQRVELRKRGFSDTRIQAMTPLEAHQALGLSRD